MDLTSTVGYGELPLSTSLVVPCEYHRVIVQLWFAVQRGNNRQRSSSSVSLTIHNSELYVIGLVCHIPRLFSAARLRPAIESEVVRKGGSNFAKNKNNLVK